MMTITTKKTSNTKRPRRMARLPEADVPPTPPPVDATPAPTPTFATATTLTKASLVLALLRHDDGATLAELVEATGWQPHTTRAHLTGLRKKGHAIEKAKRDDATCYRIGEAG